MIRNSHIDNSPRFKLTATCAKVVIEVSHKINDNFKESFTTAQLAKEFNISQSLLNRGFKVIYKKNLRQYRLEKAMQYALEQMGEGVLLKELAQELGYFNRKGLSRAFKKVYGVVPTNYKKQNEASSFI